MNRTSVLVATLLSAVLAAGCASMPGDDDLGWEPLEVPTSRGRVASAVDGAAQAPSGASNEIVAVTRPSVPPRRAAQQTDTIASSAASPAATASASESRVPSGAPPRRLPAPESERSPDLDNPPQAIHPVAWVDAHEHDRNQLLHGRGATSSTPGPAPRRAAPRPAASAQFERANPLRTARLLAAGENRLRPDRRSSTTEPLPDADWRHAPPSAAPERIQMTEEAPAGIRLEVSEAPPPAEVRTIALHIGGAAPTHVRTAAVQPAYDGPAESPAADLATYHPSVEVPATGSAHEAHALTDGPWGEVTAADSPPAVEEAATLEAPAAPADDLPVIINGYTPQRLAQPANTPPFAGHASLGQEPPAAAQRAAPAQRPRPAIILNRYALADEEEAAAAESSGTLAGRLHHYRGLRVELPAGDDAARPAPAAIRRPLPGSE